MAPGGAGGPLNNGAGGGAVGHPIASHAAARASHSDPSSLAGDLVNCGHLCGDDELCYALCCGDDELCYARCCGDDELCDALCCGDDDLCDALCCGDVELCDALC